MLCLQIYGLFKYWYRDVFWLNLDLIALKWKQKRCFVIKNAIKFIHGVPERRFHESGCQKDGQEHERILQLGTFLPPHKRTKRTNNHLFCRTARFFSILGRPFSDLDFWMDFSSIWDEFRLHFCIIFRWFFDTSNVDVSSVIFDRIFDEKNNFPNNIFFWNRPCHIIE